MNRQRYQSLSHLQGFTLVELVLVIVILGAIGTTATVRLNGFPDSQFPMRIDLFGSALRHVQSTAISWNKTLVVTLNTTGFSVSCKIAEATPPCNQSPVKDPATKKSFVHVVENVNSIVGPDLEFDSWGRPLEPATGNFLTADYTYVLSAGQVSEKVVVKPVTGFIIARAP